MVDTPAVRPLSLRRFHVIWLCVSLAGCLSVLTGWEAARLYQQLAQQQDQRLAAAVSSWTDKPPSSDGRAEPQTVRLTKLDGEPVAGARSLPPYLWPQELTNGARPTLYFSQTNGELLRVATALVARDGVTEPLVLQITEPLSLRFPALKDIWSESLAAFYLGVAMMFVLSGAGVWLSRRWTMRAAASFESTAQEEACYHGPGELYPAFTHMQQLNADNRRWVNEQRRFLADAAHQLRTPMTVLRTQLQAALHSSGDIKPTLNAMIHTVDRVTGMANQLLSVSKLEQLKRDGKLLSLPLRQAVRDAVVELSPLIARKRLDFALEGDEVMVSGEPMMLGELLLNLLANAVHHSRTGARLGVVLRQGLPWTELVVWDEGESIDSDVKPRLFTPFSAGKGGVGLGLSICQQLAEAMGARIALHNRVEDGRAVGVDAVVAWTYVEPGATATNSQPVSSS